MNEIPTRLAAALLDRYRLLVELGAGGMVDRQDTGVALGESELVDLAPDGRFLVWSGADAGADSDVRQLVVVTNWLQVLRDRLGGGAP